MQAQAVFSTILTFVKIFNQSKEMYRRLKKAQERQDKHQQRRASEVRTTTVAFAHSCQSVYWPWPLGRYR
jgi:hypothetical protein